jgi:putative membrane protein insertion efficiency factor
MRPAEQMPPRPRRWRALAVLAVCLVLVGFDVSRAPGQQITARVLRAGIHLYQHTASPVLSAMGARCRFEPSCSHYADAVIARHGALEGSWLTVRRIARCGPWTPAGTIDPPR